MRKLTQEEIIIWFKGLEGHSRIELMCALLDSCLPLELRFLGTYLEYAAGKHYSHLQKWERDANSKHTLYFGNLSDHKTRRRLCIFIALLHSHNKTVALKLFNLLHDYNTFLQSQLTTVPENKNSVIINDELQQPDNFTNDENIDNSVDWTEETSRNEMKLLLSMSSLHPAFKFNHRQELREQFSKFTEHEKPHEGLDIREENLIDFDTACANPSIQQPVCNTMTNTVPLIPEVHSPQKLPLLPNHIACNNEVYTIAHNFPHQPFQRVPQQPQPVFIQQPPTNEMYPLNNNKQHLIYFPVVPGGKTLVPNVQTNTIIQSQTLVQQQNFQTSQTNIVVNNNVKESTEHCNFMQQHNVIENIQIQNQQQQRFTSNNTTNQLMEKFKNIRSKERYLSETTNKIDNKNSFYNNQTYSEYERTHPVSSTKPSMLTTPTKQHSSGKPKNGYVHSHPYDDPAIVSSKVLKSPNHEEHHTNGPTTLSLNDYRNKNDISPSISPSSSPTPFTRSSSPSHKHSRANLSCANWLKSIRLHKYHNKLKGYKFNEMKELDDDHLCSLGLTKGARARFRQNVDLLRNQGFNEFLGDWQFDEGTHNGPSNDTLHEDSSTGSSSHDNSPLKATRYEAKREGGSDSLFTSLGSVTCYNCGHKGHYGDECTEMTMEAQTYSRYAFHLDFTHSSDTPPPPPLEDTPTTPIVITSPHTPDFGVR